MPNLKIVGGIEAVSNSWPAQIVVTQSYQATHNGRLVSCRSLCGGTLINRYTVLSAAHCIQDSTIECYYATTGQPVTVPVKYQYYPTLESMFDIYLGIQDISFLANNAGPPSPGVHIKVAKVIKVNIEFPSY